MWLQRAHELAAINKTTVNTNITWVCSNEIAKEQQNEEEKISKKYTKQFIAKNVHIFHLYNCKAITLS